MRNARTWLELGGQRSRKREYRASKALRSGRGRPHGAGGGTHHSLRTKSPPNPGLAWGTELYFLPRLRLAAQAIACVAYVDTGKVARLSCWTTELCSMSAITHVV